MCALRLVENDSGFELYEKDTLITRYMACEDLPRDESPKPCFHPIYTPSGDLITEYRPEDHYWHTGLYFGWVHVNDSNLWGGPWYLPEKKKYERVPDSHGVQRHDAFTDRHSATDEVRVTEKLTWLDRKNDPLAHETRQFAFHSLESRKGWLWRIDTDITPAGDTLTLGASRAARYSGLELRMGPPFADAEHFSSEGLEGHENIMRQRAKWVSAEGAGGGMVVMMDHPDNPRYPVTWFTRKNLLGAGLLMEEDLTVEQTEVLRLKYGFAILDERVGQDEIQALYRQYLEW